MVARKEWVWDLRESNKPWIEFKVTAGNGRIYLNGSYTGFNETEKGNICKGGNIVASKTSKEAVNALKCVTQRMMWISESTSNLSLPDSSPTLS